MNKHDNIPVRLIIAFVGVIGFFSLFVGAWLYWMGKSGEGVMAITNGCVMGLIGLLGRTQPQAPATGTPADPVTVETAPDKPLETVAAAEKESSE